MGKRKTQQSDSEWLNNATYLDYYYRLKELAINMFEWVNLPLSVDERFMELCLYDKGYCIYFNDEIMGNLSLSGAIGGQLDVYNVPVQRTAMASNGYSQTLDITNSVLVYNNYLRTPTELTIQLYARRLYEIERTIDVNVKGQKTPVIILASEQQKLTMQNLLMKYDGNEPFIYGDTDMDITNIKTINTGAPFVADKLLNVKHQIWNEALTFCGIENSNQDKKERMVADEVGSNYGNIEAQRNVMLNARRQAVKKINTMFGTNIEVYFNSSLETLVNKDNVSRETLNEDNMGEGEENE